MRGPPLYEVGQVCIWAQTRRVRILAVNPKPIQEIDNIYMVEEVGELLGRSIKTTARETLLKPVHPLLLLAEAAEREE